MSEQGPYTREGLDSNGCICSHEHMNAAWRAGRESAGSPPYTACEAGQWARAQESRAQAAERELAVCKKELANWDSENVALRNELAVSKQRVEVLADQVAQLTVKLKQAEKEWESWRRCAEARAESVGHLSGELASTESKLATWKQLAETRDQRNLELEKERDGWERTARYRDNRLRMAFDGLVALNRAAVPEKPPLSRETIDELKRVGHDYASPLLEAVIAELEYLRGRIQ